VAVLIVAGISTLVAGPNFGLVMGMIAQGVLVYIGIMPIMSVLITMLLGMLILSRRQVAY
jgi:uncharacterized membrane protein